MTTIIVDAEGTIDLPEEVLAASRIEPGSELVVLVREGRILLLDRSRFQRQVEQPARALLGRFRNAVSREPTRPFLGELAMDEFATLSDEQEQELWNTLTVEAGQETTDAERDIPTHFRPARQEPG
jgi:hypothetical protein